MILHLMVVLVYIKKKNHRLTPDDVNIDKKCQWAFDVLYH